MTLLPPPSRMYAEGPVIIAAIRANMVLAVEITHPSDWPDMIARAVVNHGGCLTMPDASNSWASHRAELALLGITGRGDDLEAAVRDWVKAAGRTLDMGKAA